MWQPSRELLKNQRVLLALTAAVSSSVGATVAHVATKRVLSRAFMQELDTQMELAREEYQRQMKVGDFADIHSAADALGVKIEYDTVMDLDADSAAELLRKFYEGKLPESIKEGVDLEDQLSDLEPGEEPVVTGDPVPLNAFDVEDPNAPEVSDYFSDQVRTDDKPFVITHDEFYENEPDHAQHHLTWWEGDMTLADENDRVIPDWAKIIGGETLMFGVGSRNADIVYIRNTKRNADYEVARSKGKYAIEVAGLGGELEHSQRMPARRRHLDY